MEENEKIQKQMEEALQQFQALEQIVKQHMTKQALSRYGNVKVAHPELAIKAVSMLASFIQSGQIDTIDDDMLKQVLKSLSVNKQYKIKRK